MFTRVALVFIYLIVLFIGARIIDLCLSVIGISSLPQRYKNLQDNVSPEQSGTRKIEEKTHSLSQEDFSGGKLGCIDDAVNATDARPSCRKSFENFQDSYSIEFSSYEHLLENVEDTKAAVWVVLIRPSSKARSSNERGNRKVATAPARKNHCIHNESISSMEDWNSLSNTLVKNGIRTGTYRCAVDVRLCRKYNVNAFSVLLSMPASSKPKGKVAMYFYKYKRRHSLSGRNMELPTYVLTWIKMKLRSRIPLLNSPDDLTNYERGIVTRRHPDLNVIYKSPLKYPPLLFSALSVKFTGRIKFVQLLSTPIHDMNKNIDNKTSPKIYAVTSCFNYSYGLKQGEKFDYLNIEIFLKTLYPETNDIFVITFVLINMCCFIELFIKLGGPLKRVLCYIWTSMLSNILLLSFWLPFTRLMQLPETGPIIDFFLNALQAAMFSEVAAMIRKDYLVLSDNFEVFCLTLIVYGLMVGYIKYKLSSHATSRPSLIRSFYQDIEEIKEFLESLGELATPSLFSYNFEEQLESLLQHLAVPSLWLQPCYATDYINQLTCWKYCKHLKLSCPTGPASMGNGVKQYGCNCSTSIPVTSLIPSIECVICLEVYACGELVKLLPCGHFFHKNCIDHWLLCGSGMRSGKCPICRWPARKTMKT